MNTEKELIFRAIDLEFTYEDCLNNLKKDELIEIRRSFQLTNVSKLKKAELVEVLNSNLKGINKEYITKNLIYDAYKVLKGIIENSEKGIGNYIVYTNDMFGVVSNLKELGLAFPGIIENDLDIVMVPKNIIEVTKNIVKSKDTEEYMLQRKKYTVLIAVYIRYYGMINKLDLEKIIKKNFDFKDLEKDVNFETTLILEDKYGKEFKINSPYIYHIRVENILSTLKEQAVRKELDYFPLTLELIEEYQENNFNSQEEKLYTYLIEAHKVEQEKAKKLVWDFIFAIQNSVPPTQATRIFTENIVFNSEEELKDLMNLVSELNNNLRMWILKGNTPKEIREKFQRKDPKSKYSFSNRRPQPVIKPIIREKKIGRNESCPCGSGKKYKKCCAKN